METFSEFLKRRESISSDYINGNSDLLAEISTQEDPATFFPPSGKVVSGASAVNTANAEGANMFKAGSTGHFEVLQSGASGDIGYWTGLQKASVMMEGRDDPIPMILRVTELFRRENGAWMLIHRHADMVKD